MPIITIDNYNDQFENTLEKELECYFPNEIWEIIKEFNDWTQDRREIQNKLAKKNQKTGLYENVVGHRAGRIAPPIKIGDEITNGGRLCGRVVKINKASVDIDRYSFVDYRRVVVIDTKPNVVIINTISAYKWKRNITAKERWIGSYTKGDNHGGFIDTWSSDIPNEPAFIKQMTPETWVNASWIMGTQIIREQHEY